MQAAGLIAGPVNAATAGSQLSTARAQLRDISTDDATGALLGLCKGGGYKNDYVYLCWRSTGK